MPSLKWIHSLLASGHLSIQYPALPVISPDTVSSVLFNRLITHISCLLCYEYPVNPISPSNFGLKHGLLSRSSDLLSTFYRTKVFAQVTDQQWKEAKALFNIHRNGPIEARKRRSPLDEKCQLRGIVLKTVIKKPKKPNSANRRCVMVRLSNGREGVAFVPGMGHNLQEHSVVLVHMKRTKDVPGLRMRCIRGCYDLPHIVKKSQQPS